jgi:hypothetical protein
MSIIPPKAVFHDTDLAQLEWVYDDVRAALEAKRGQLEEDTKLSIRRRLFMLARNGMGDTGALRNNR